MVGTLSAIVAPAQLANGVTIVIHGQSPWWSVITGIIGAVGALGGVAAGYFVQRTLYSRTGRDAASLRKTLHCEAQLTKLYGPLMTLTQHTKELHQILAIKEPGWRLIDHIEEVLLDQARAPIVRQIIETNGRISSIIVNRAGLVLDGVVPQCFLEFLRHAKVVEAAVAAKHRTALFHGEEYPKDLDREIRRACNALLTQMGLSNPEVVPANPSSEIEPADLNTPVLSNDQQEIVLEGPLPVVSPGEAAVELDDFN